MEQFKQRLSKLQTDTIHVMQEISRMLMSNGGTEKSLEEQMDNFMYGLETLCIKSRTLVEQYRPKKEAQPGVTGDEISDVCGSIELTCEGWLHITLNTLLPNSKHKSTAYIGDTVSRLLRSYAGELPYFERAFLAIVEYCNYDNHNALDNDNKGWKMIPNALKGKVIEDDNQFILSMGLFTEISEIPRCEIYLMTPDDASYFMDMLLNGTL